jgi:thioredoxin reductase (NADPH)
MMENPLNPLSVAIIGGGVAGMSCALWLKHLGFFPIILEQKSQLGGQLRQLNRINRWVLGFPGKTSMELADIYAAHVIDEAIGVLYNKHLTAVTPISTGFDLRFDEAGKSGSLSVLALMIATGVRVLGYEAFGDIPGLQPLSEKGLISFFPLSHLDKLTGLKGKDVAVIGGGDNAHYTAKDLALAGARVYLLIRSSHKARNAIRKEVEVLMEQGAIVEHKGLQVSAFRQEKGEIEIVLRDVHGINVQITVDAVFVRAGFAANTEFLEAFEAFSGLAKESGYLATDPVKRTSIPWIYAIGDVSSVRHQSVACAIADGAIAAQDLSERI